MPARRKNQNGKTLVSRRDVLRAGGPIIAVGALGTYAPSAATPATVAAVDSAVTFEMVDPTGPTEITELFGPRIKELSGKTIGLMNAGWEGGRTLALIADLLKRKFPNITVIPSTEFPGTRNDVDRPKIVELVKKFGCNAVIIGNGG
jgi:hypothetical protein